MTFCSMFFPILSGAMLSLLASWYDLRAAALGVVIFVAMLGYGFITRIDTY